jgi:hypothetical protein
MTGVAWSFTVEVAYSEVLNKQSECVPRVSGTSLTRGTGNSREVELALSPNLYGFSAQISCFRAGTVPIMPDFGLKCDLVGVPSRTHSDYLFSESGFHLEPRASKPTDVMISIDAVIRNLFAMLWESCFPCTHVHKWAMCMCICIYG